MRLVCFALLIVAAASQGIPSLHGAPTAPETGDSAAAVLARAWPFYDFADAGLRPWHMKVSYQVYDAKGKHPQPGVYEYWWASPTHFRSTWTRPGLIHTDWHLSSGRLAYEERGYPVSLFEHELESALIAPLPKARDLDPAQFRLESEKATGKESCLTVVPVVSPAEADARGSSANGLGTQIHSDQRPYPTYCFDEDEPVLRSVYSLERVLTEYTDVRQTQGRYLAHGVSFTEGDRKLLTARVETVEAISTSDPALNPPVNAARTEVFVDRDVNLKDANMGMSPGMLIRKTEPPYPLDARRAGIQGKVELEAMIGTDGKIHDLVVISAPAASLAASSFAAVSRWEYRPYRMNGRPVPVQTTITVTFSLGK